MLPGIEETVVISEENPTHLTLSSRIWLRFCSVQFIIVAAISTTATTGTTTPTATTITRCYTTSLMLQVIIQAPATHQLPVLMSMLVQLQNRCCYDSTYCTATTHRVCGLRWWDVMFVCVRYYYWFVLKIAPQSTAVQKGEAPKPWALLHYPQCSARWLLYPSLQRWKWEKMVRFNVLLFFFLFISLHVPLSFSLFYPKGKTKLKWYFVSKKSFTVTYCYHGFGNHTTVPLFVQERKSAGCTDSPQRLKIVMRREYRWKAPRMIQYEIFIMWSFMTYGWVLWVSYEGFLK